MKITRCALIEEIITKEGGRDAAFDKIIIPQLKFIILESLPNLTSFYSGSNILACPPLKTITIKDCLKIYTKDHLASFFSSMVVLPTLEDLPLSSVRIEKIWQSEPPAASSCFQNLTSLVIDGCGHLKYIFSPSMVKNLVQLKALDICNCKYIERVIAEEERISKMLFPVLYKLKLKDLPKLSRFGAGILAEFPSLDDLWIESCPNLKSFISNFTCIDITMSKEPEEMNLENCPADRHPLFDEKVAFPNLKKMILSHLDNLQRIWHHQLHEDSFCKLKVVRVKHCKNILTIFPSNALGRLSTLESLRISDCALLQEVYEFPGALSEERTSKLLFLELETLKLKDLPKLSRFGAGNLAEFPALDDLRIESCPNLKSFISNFTCIDITVSKEPEEMNLENSPADRHPLFDEKVALPNLEKMVLSHLDNLQRIWHHQFHEDSFCKLEVVRVKHCKNILTIFPSNALGRLSTLESLRISDCALLQEVYEFPGALLEERTSKLLFLDLETLKLKDLPKLSRFGTGHLAEFPSLDYLRIESCPNLKSFISTFTCIDITLSKEPEEMNLENSCAETHPLFDEKVAFPILRNMILFRLDDLQRIWHHQLHEDSFCKLKLVRVEHCKKISTIFPSNVLERLSIVERLEISDCASLKEVSEFQGLNVVETTSAEEERISKLFPGLKWLILKDLPRLTRFCNFTGNFIELSLLQLRIENCPSMKTFISNSICGHMISSKELEEINSKEYLHNYMIQPFFDKKVRLPSLKMLCIKHMDELRKIWDDQLSLDYFCKLKNLRLQFCNKLVNIFPSNMLGIHQKLERLKVENCDSIEEIFEVLEKNSCLVEETVAKKETVLKFAFSNLYVLWLRKLPSLKSLCSRIHNSEWPVLKELKVYGCDKVEIFASEFLSYQENHGESQHETPLQKPLFLVDKEAFPCLEKLELCELPSLLILWRENSQPSYTFQNLKTLKVAECSSLENLCSSSVSFQNLMSLQVSKCDGLRYLFTPSKAKTLAQLTSMNVSDCKMMEQIIIHLGEAKDSIVFNKLEYLELHCLPSLTSFSCGDFTLEFPSLEKVIMRQCLKMETFVHGVLSTPKVQRLQLTEGEDEIEKFWEGDLNSTIRRLFKNMNVQISEED